MKLNLSLSLSYLIITAFFYCNIFLTVIFALKGRPHALLQFFIKKKGSKESQEKTKTKKKASYPCKIMSPSILLNLNAQWLRIHSQNCLFWDSLKSAFFFTENILFLAVISTVRDSVLSLRIIPEIKYRFIILGCNRYRIYLENRPIKPNGL